MRNRFWVFSYSLYRAVLILSHIASILLQLQTRCRCTIVHLHYPQMHLVYLCFGILFRRAALRDFSLFFQQVQNLSNSPPLFLVFPRICLGSILTFSFFCASVYLEYALNVHCKLRPVWQFCEQSVRIACVILKLSGDSQRLNSWTECGGYHDWLHHDLFTMPAVVTGVHHPHVFIIFLNKIYHTTVLTYFYILWYTKI